MRPAANAPTIGARPATPARWDNRKQNARETPIRTPAPRSRAAPENTRGVIHVPMRSEPARNPTAFRVISTCGSSPGGEKPTGPGKKSAPPCVELRVDGVRRDRGDDAGEDRFVLEFRLPIQHLGGEQGLSLIHISEPTRLGM